MTDNSFPQIGDLTPPKVMPRRRKKPHERMKLSKGERAVFVKLGKLGGAARAKKLKPGELSNIGKQGAAARWKKNKKSH